MLPRIPWWELSFKGRFVPRVAHSSLLLACVGRFDWTESLRGSFGVLLESAQIRSPSASRAVASWRKLLRTRS